MKIRVLILCCLALAACEEMPVPPGAEAAEAAPPPPPFSPRRQEVADPTDPCSAGAYLGLIGREASTIGRAETETFRILYPGAVLTEDSVPARLNVRVNAAGVVERVHCG